ncbi:hypothetical protein F4861DRAFT_543973 [Xylaria intraflava]|nr:hypothetical protein F4861DRAFT_543973 [Xylaria intraflava]
MALGVATRLKSYVRRKLVRTGRRSIDADASTDACNITAAESTARATPYAADLDVSAAAATTTTIFDEQQGSSFFRKLPPELRKMIYAYVWQGPYDHMYHESNGRHLHFKDGHWVHTRCVMYQEDDEDVDLIQKQMDMIHHAGGPGNLLMWQRRLASTWGRRHWRCEERIEYGEPTSIDRTDLGALMVVCKRMHPEVMESFLESHKMIFNDVFSAHRFLVRHPTAPLLRHIRNLDLTLSLPFHGFTSLIGHPDTDELTATTAESSAQPAQAPTDYLSAILAVVADKTTCLHSLRVSLDVYDRGPWREIPERALLPALTRMHVRRGKGGQANYTVELPPTLPIRAYYAGLQDLDDECGDLGEEGSDVIPFRVVRRSPLRYWQFHPGEVEHFAWETCPGVKPRQHFCVALRKAARGVPGPHPIDFAEG